MKTCERLVKAGYFISNQPARLLAHGFREMQVMVTILVYQYSDSTSLINGE
jgi:hypothetical protein